MYPKKLAFNSFNYRTARLIKNVELTYKLEEGFSENKNGQAELNFNLSTSVTLI